MEGGPPLGCGLSKVIGPPRSGKGLHIVIPAILDAPGPVVTTSTRPDNLDRSRFGGHW